jgi:hypothetical protein
MCSSASCSQGQWPVVSDQWPVFCVPRRPRAFAPLNVISKFFGGIAASVSVLLTADH